MKKKKLLSVSTTLLSPDLALQLIRKYLTNSADSITVALGIVPPHHPIYPFATWLAKNRPAKLNTDLYSHVRHYIISVLHPIAEQAPNYLEATRTWRLQPCLIDITAAPKIPV